MSTVLILCTTTSDNIDIHINNYLKVLNDETKVSMNFVDNTNSLFYSTFKGTDSSKVVKELWNADAQKVVTK